jgi:hypothetical protein
MATTFLLFGAAAKRSRRSWSGPSALRAVDPDRLWAHLEAVERQRAADQAANARTARRTLAAAAIGAAAAVVASLILVLLVARLIAL